MRSFILILFALFVFLCNAQNIFVWKPTVDASNPNSYANKQLPCQNDDLLVDNYNRSAIIYIGESVKLHSLLLPNNGEVLFGSNVDLGKKAGWQCENEETRIAQVLEYPPSDFYDPKNWLIYEGLWPGHLLNKPRLDAMKVPGDQDTVYFSANGSSQILMNYPAVVRKMYIGNESVSSDEMYRFLLTLEGRFRIQLGRELATTVEINHKRYMWPYGQAFSIRDLPRPRYGYRLSNAQQPQFTGICLNIDCPKAEDYCDNPLTLIGNCCPVCAAAAIFRTSNEPVFWIVQQGLKKLEDMYPSYLGISKIRIDSNAAHPAYQLAIIADHPKNYDETQFSEVLNLALYTSNNWYTSTSTQMFDIHIYTSIQKSLFHFGLFLKNLFIVLSSLVLISGIFVFEYRRNARLRLWLANRWTPNDRFQVAFKRGGNLVRLWRRRGTADQNNDQLAPLSFNVEFENMVFRNENESRQESTNNEVDYLSLNETETLS